MLSPRGRLIVLARPSFGRRDSVSLLAAHKARPFGGVCGPASPSPEDLAMTERMIDAGELLGIRSSTTSSSGEKGSLFALGRGLGR